MFLWIFLSFILVVALAGILIYNRLIQSKNQLAEGWSGVDVQLKRRHDLIPNLVTTVKGYAGYEKSLLEKITQLRSQATSSNNIADKSVLEKDLAQNVKTIFAVAENYPDLKANKNFIDLQTSLTQIEDEIQLARRYYNGCVRNFNILVQSFPSNIIANTFQFNKAEFFQIEEPNERGVSNVQL
jgi:LemA protein